MKLRSTFLVGVLALCFYSCDKQTVSVVKEQPEQKEQQQGEPAPPPQVQLAPPPLPEQKEEFAALFNGQAENKPGGETFSYEWLQSTAASGAVPWMTPQVVDCIAGEAQSNSAYSKDGAIISTALDELGGKCGYNAFAGAKCPDDSTPDANGICNEVKTVLYCPDNSELVGGQCPVVSSDAGTPILCPDGSIPNENGLCSKTETVQLCPDLSAPVNGKCPVASSGSLSNLCSDGSLPQNGSCPQHTEGGASALAAGVTPCDTCSLSFKVIWPKNYGGQLSDIVRKYITTGSMIAKGDLYLRLCSDEACKQPTFLGKVDTVNIPSTGKAYSYSIGSLPEGEHYAQPIFNTAYRKEWQGPCTGLGDCPGPFDVIQMKGTELTMNNNYDAAHNPPAGTTLVSIHGPTTIPDPIYLGHFEFDRSFYITPPTEDGYVMAAASKGVYRNAIRFLNLQNYKTDVSLTLKMKDGSEFDGDICGFVPAQKDTVYALGYGHGKCGGYVFKLRTDPTDPAKVAQVDPDPIFIPHPDNATSTQEVMACDKFNVESMPHPCRGTYVEKGNLLYLVEFKGAGSLNGSLPYPLVGIDLNKKTVIENGTKLSIYPDAAKRAIRGIVTDNKNIYVLEASWSPANQEKLNKIWRFAIDPISGVLQDAKTPTTMEGTANFKCSTAYYPPAFSSYYSGSDQFIVVGSDKSAIFYKVQPDTLGKIGEVDLSGYGQQFTDFTLSPDRSLLYAMSTCNAEKKMNIHSGKPSSTKTISVDRQLIAIFDLTKPDAKGLPSLIHTDRDFDGDGVPDGGGDAQSTNIKANTARWIENGGGIVPPVSFTGPQLVSSNKTLFLRGTGIKGDGQMSIDSSGLGQEADLGIYDLASGNVITFRDYILWLNGPGSKEPKDNFKACGRWGYDLDESTGELSVGALMYVGPTTKWHNEPTPLFTPKPSCISFTYTDWSSCLVNQKTRQVVSALPEGCEVKEVTPELSQSCQMPPPPPPVCTGFEYTVWSSCESGKQTRTVVANVPLGCEIKDVTPMPILEKSCGGTVVPELLKKPPTLPRQDIKDILKNDSGLPKALKPKIN